jgi:hypothetical protein
VRFRQLGLVVVFSTGLMLVIDNNIVNVALPDQQRSLHFSPANLSLVVTGYALSFAGFIVLSGKVGSSVGAKRTLIIGTRAFIGACGRRIRAERRRPDHRPSGPGRWGDRRAQHPGLACGQHRARSATHPAPSACSSRPGRAEERSG